MAFGKSLSRPDLCEVLVDRLLPVVTHKQPDPRSIAQVPVMHQNGTERIIVGNSLMSRKAESS